MVSEMRLIDANVVEAALLDFRDEMCDYEPDDVFEECTYNVIMDCIRTMNAAPTIDPESLRPKGRIVLKERHRGGFQIMTGVDEFGNEHTVRIDTRTVGREPYCSKCGAALADSFQDYCPRCGAKMEG